ncbi:putative inorganic carbon transporter subunit DabA [Lutibacter sp.]|uniref:putative inorganic carbon transporter subunit DabA n=1 Tax=Lutibacter sp. TaxID=1925666 RepID=UPI0025B9139E|nr:putative inorganic carbon transporter subunit DabA [Lutibacter sp.]
MVVTQCIKNHYYFSTIDNDVFVGGYKITHNITGKFGVVNGNGGDLKMGLRLQSIPTSD